MSVTIDPHSGFCFGVVNAIKKAEEELAKGGPLYCLGDIVHNGQEVERLARMGLVTIDHREFARLRGVKVLLRAHGEPPSTYRIARRNGITLIDASCPVVLALQRRIKQAYESLSDDRGQIVIYGKKGHAEVNGLVGQTDDSAIVVESQADLDKIDYSRPVTLFSQTTQSLDGFNRVVEHIAGRIRPQAAFTYSDTICRHVAKRIPDIIRFARANDTVLFVSGKKSSNGKELFEHCRRANPRTYLVTSPDEVDSLSSELSGRVGICGATSTPVWLMEAVAGRARLVEQPADNMPDKK